MSNNEMSNIYKKDGRIFDTEGGLLFDPADDAADLQHFIDQYNQLEKWLSDNEDGQFDFEARQAHRMDFAIKFEWAPASWWDRIVELDNEASAAAKAEADARVTILDNYSSEVPF